MRQLSETLLAAQKQAAATPYVKVEARNTIAGVVRYDWSRLYEGSEDDGPHALSMPADGSLVRVRITPPADSRKLYIQRVADPGPESDYSQWAYSGQYNALAVAVASLGAEVSVFWIKTNREIRRIVSTDYGASWGSPELIDYTPTTSACGLAAAYKPGGDLAIFFADQANLYVKKQVSGQWQSSLAWDKTTGNLSGVGCVYAGDWNLLVTGEDASGNGKLWSLVYGDGGGVNVGAWSDLQEIASAPSGGDYEYHQPFLDKPDVFRCFFAEKFTGTEACQRPFWSHIVAGADFVDSLWREPIPFNLSSECGLAMAHHGGYAWLACPAGVWRADLTARSLDLTANVVSLRQEIDGSAGVLTVELRNDDGRYASPGQGDLAVLDIGCQLNFSPGYVTAAGNECSSGQSYSLEACEHASSGGRAILVLHGRDGRVAVNGWSARQQLRWNKGSSDYSVMQILAFMLAHSGLSLEAVSQSTVIGSYYPDFTVHPGNTGGDIIRKLLSFVPDMLFIEGSRALLVNPQPSDSSVYSYGGEHGIREGRYRWGAWELNRVQVEGFDGAGSQMILAESLAWDEVNRMYDRLEHLEDRNLDTVAAVRQRGQAYLRQAEVEAAGGDILVPVNCGQQLFDVIDVTDVRAGLEDECRRVIGMTLVYNPHRGEYYQRLRLGAV